MQRRRFIGVSLSLGVSATLPFTARATADTADALFDRLVDGSLEASPLYATLFSLDAGARAALKWRLDDRGEGDRLGLYAPFLDAGPALAALPAETVPRRRQWVQTALWFAETTRQMSGMPHLTVDMYGYPIPYAVTQLSGAYVEVPDILATQHTIETAADCDAYLARLAQLGPVIDQDTAMSRSQAVAGIIPPDFICDRALAQLRTLRASGGAKTGLVQALASGASKAGIGGDWEGRASTLVDGPVAAALARQQAHLEGLRRQATSAAGVGSRPGGVAFYATALGFHTTTADTPEEVHRVGLKQAAATKAELDALMVRLGHRTGSVGERLTALGKDPAHLFADDDAGRAALLAYVRERIDDVKRRLPAAFNRMPRTPLDIRRVPVETELGAPSASSLPGSVDGTRPGVIQFNLSSTANWPKWQLPTVAYHEGYPGHHYQGSLLNEAGGTPLLFKLLVPNAYNEGWALYAEQLADELGVYDELPIGRLGRLQDDLFRSCRLVVDTGIHALGWTRDRAIAYLVEEGGQTPDTARREIERYVVWPGQACSYKVGQLELLRQRALAKARLGERFSIKAFHDAVLLGGGMPLSVMATSLEALGR